MWQRALFNVCPLSDGLFLLNFLFSHINSSADGLTHRHASFLPPSLPPYHTGLSRQAFLLSPLTQTYLFCTQNLFLKLTFPYLFVSLTLPKYSFFLHVNTICFLPLLDPPTNSMTANAASRAGFRWPCIFCCCSIISWPHSHSCSPAISVPRSRQAFDWPACSRCAWGRGTLWS